jgi:hypothetical protein
LKQERHLDNIDVIKIYVANFNSTPWCLSHLSQTMNDIITWRVQPLIKYKGRGPSKGRFRRSRNSTSKQLKEQTYAWIEWIEKLERGNWLGVNVKNTWLGSSRIKGFDKVATLICNGPTQTTRLGINHNIIIICTITKVKNIPWNKRFTFHVCGGVVSPFQRQHLLER